MNSRCVLGFLSRSCKTAKVSCPGGFLLTFLIKAESIPTYLLFIIQFTNEPCITNDNVRLSYLLSCRFCFVNSEVFYYVSMCVENVCVCVTKSVKTCKWKIKACDHIRSKGAWLVFEGYFDPLMAICMIAAVGPTKILILWHLCRKTDFIVIRNKAGHIKSKKHEH